MHVHHATGEAKVWLEPAIAVAHNFGLGERNLAYAIRLIREHEDEIRAAWRSHFAR